MQGKKIIIVTPAPAHSRKGNRVTALRWSRILRGLGHHVEIQQSYEGERADLLVALHARRSFASIQRFARDHSAKPLIVTLTGTDLYADIKRSARARKSLTLATRLVVLQPHGISQMPRGVQHKARTIYQSVPAPRTSAKPRHDRFDVCVIGHLRPVKDPFRAAMAIRKLPDNLDIHIVHIGAALSAAMAQRARKEARANRHYEWLGELPRWKTLQRLQSSRLLVVSSRMEGGPNVAGEAIAASVPILSSEISGMIGMLGPDYPGYFRVGDTERLARLLRAAATDKEFYQSLCQQCRRAIPLISPERERKRWRDLLAEL